MEKGLSLYFSCQNPVDCNIWKAHELNALLQYMYMYVLICWAWEEVYSLVNDRTVTGSKAIIKFNWENFSLSWHIALDFIMKVTATNQFKSHDVWVSEVKNTCTKLW